MRYHLFRIVSKGVDDPERVQGFEGSRIQVTYKQALKMNKSIKLPQPRYDSGIYKYDPHNHEILLTITGDKRPELCRAGLSQGSIRNAAAVMILCAVFERVTGSYGQRGIQYVYMEAGHAIQNASLQAVSLGLGSVVIGAFNDNDVKHIVNLEPDEQPLLLLSVGKHRDV